MSTSTGYSYGMVLSTQENVLFLNITINDGNGYNLTSGQFVAVVDGLYDFDTQICFDKGFGASCTIVKETSGRSATTVAQSENRDADYPSCLIVSALIRLNVLDKVYVLCDYHAYVRRFPDYINFFKGVRIGP